MNSDLPSTFPSSTSNFAETVSASNPTQPTFHLPDTNKHRRLNADCSGNFSLPPLHFKIFSINRALALLVDEFDRHRLASQEFPPSVSHDTIRSAIESFRNSLQSKSDRHVCSSCGVFTTSTDTKTFADDDDRLDKLKDAGLDTCGYRDGCWMFCTSCHADILRFKIPKFSALNSVNVLTCDDYPEALKDLTFIEEAVIARRHPVGSILKLRPGKCRSPSSYYALRGHMVVMPQNPGPLLQILPSPDLRFQDLIKVFWISANITQVDASDHSEREGYVASLESDNFENDLQAASNDILPDDTVFASGSLYTDLNGDRVNCDQQLLQRLASSIEGTAPTTDANEAEGVMDFGECDIVGDEDYPLNNSNEHSAAPPGNSSYIQYGFRKETALSSVWSDPLYFTTAFPSLFPIGSGGHLDKRPIKVSLEAFAKWALNHHSRRYLLFP
ncbi:hypothetical protein V8E54_006599 [Elaphomyces granulatus]